MAETICVDEQTVISPGITVAIRIRPLSASEIECGSEPYHWGFQDNHLIPDSRETADSITWGFDHVFPPESSNDDLYERLGAPMVQRVINGYNGTVIAYGQARSGKSHSIFGQDDDMGICLQCVWNILEIMKSDLESSYLLRVSCFEIYNEQINDLLQFGDASQNLRIVSVDPDLGPVIANLAEVDVACLTEMMQLIKRSQKNRKQRDEQDSRGKLPSHTIIRLWVESKKGALELNLEESDDKDAYLRMGSAESTIKPTSTTAYLQFFDLASSERKKNKATETRRVKDDTYVDRSLIALSSVVQKLVEPPLDNTISYNGSQNGRAFVPYRDSKLTRIMKDSLGGNAYTSVLCTGTADRSHMEEMISTLKFGQLCSKIENRPRANIVIDAAILLELWREKMFQLRTYLKSNGTVVQLNSNPTSQEGSPQPQQPRQGTIRHDDRQDNVKIPTSEKEKFRAIFQDTELPGSPNSPNHEENGSASGVKRIDADERNSSAEKLRLQRRIFQLTEQMELQYNRFEVIGEREAQVDAEAQQVKKQWGALKRRGEQLDDEQTKLFKLFTVLDERELHLQQQFGELRLLFNTWNSTKDDLSRKEKDLALQDQDMRQREAELTRQQDEKRKILAAINLETDKLELLGASLSEEKDVHDMSLLEMTAESVRLKQQKLEISSREDVANDLSQLLMTREQDVEQRESLLKIHEAEVSASQAAMREKEESLKRGYSDVEASQAAVIEKESNLARSTLEVDRMRDELKVRLIDTDRREGALATAEEAANEIKKKLQAEKSNFEQQKKDLSCKQNELDGREKKVTDMESRYANLQKQDKDLSVRIAAQKEKEDKFYMIEAAQISNKHARELREVESLLAEQLELVYTLQRENSASKKKNFERDATISKLKIDLAEASKRSRNEPSLQSYTAPNMALRSAADQTELQKHLLGALSQTETLLRSTLMGCGQRTTVDVTKETDTERIKLTNNSFAWKPFTSRQVEWFINGLKPEQDLESVSEVLTQNQVLEFYHSATEFVLGIQSSLNDKDTSLESFMRRMPAASTGGAIDRSQLRQVMNGLISEPQDYKQRDVSQNDPALQSSDLQLPH